MKLLKYKKVLLYIFLSCVSIFTILPFYIMFTMGTYYSEDLFKGISLIPSNYVMENLKRVMESNYLRAFFNSTYVSFSAAVLSVLTSAMAGYAFAKYSFKFKKGLFNTVLAVMMIPPQLGLIAFIWEMKMLGWSNTHLPLILPALTSSLGTFWMTQYIKDSVPNEVIESGRIDGCREFRVFFQLVLPFVKPAIASVGLVFFLWHWNSYMIPMLVLSKYELYTIPLFISSLNNLYRVDYGAQLLGLSISTIPIIFIFIFFSKTLIRGLMGIAVKG